MHQVAQRVARYHRVQHRFRTDDMRAQTLLHDHLIYRCKLESTHRVFPALQTDPYKHSGELPAHRQVAGDDQTHEKLAQASMLHRAPVPAREEMLPLLPEHPHARASSPALDHNIEEIL